MISLVCDQTRGKSVNLIHLHVLVVIRRRIFGRYYFGERLVHLGTLDHENFVALISIVTDTVGQIRLFPVNQAFRVVVDDGELMRRLDGRRHERERLSGYGIFDIGGYRDVVLATVLDRVERLLHDCFVGRLQCHNRLVVGNQLFDGDLQSNAMCEKLLNALLRKALNNLTQKKFFSIILETSLVILTKSYSQCLTRY